MRTVHPSELTSPFEIDVCGRCEFVWVERGEHPDFDVPNRATLEAEVLRTESEISRDEPVGSLSHVAAFLSLPVEMSGRARPRGAWLTIGLILLMAFIHLMVASSYDGFLVLKNYGFYATDPFRHAGLNLFSWAFLHADFGHIFGNLYVFALFADDVEERLGWEKFLLFVFAGIVVSALATIGLGGFLPGSQVQSPLVGFSGVVSATLVYYALAFPKARVAYLVPLVHWLTWWGTAVPNWLRRLRWIRIPVWLMALFYFAGDLLGYLYGQRRDLTNVSHSAHLGGAVFAIFAWLLTQDSSEPSEAPVA